MAEAGVGPHEWNPSHRTPLLRLMVRLGWATRFCRRCYEPERNRGYVEARWLGDTSPPRTPGQVIAVAQEDIKAGALVEIDARTGRMRAARR